MNKLFFIQKIPLPLLAFIIFLTGILVVKMDIHAADIPNISLTFDSSDQSVIVEGIPAYDSTGAIQYELNGYMNYQDERVETFCYAPSVYPHHIPDKQAYIFNWSDAEFLLPCSGDYQFTAYVTAIYSNGTGMVEEDGYTWTIHGTDIETVPDSNPSLAITKNPETFASTGIDEFWAKRLPPNFPLIIAGILVSRHF